MAAIVDNFTKEELEEIVKNSSSMNQVINKLGYATHSGCNSTTVKNRLLKYNIDYSHFSNVAPGKIARNEENVFIENSTASQQTLRRWYLKGEYSPYICSICGQEPEWQGKPLTLILDHINGRNHDDRLENLRWVCPNCNQQLPTTGFTGKENKLSRQKYCCDCGKPISHSALRCKECHLKNKVDQYILPVSREELKNEIRLYPFTQLALKYQVSDNAIRKWCEKYNLPRTKKEINSYSDEEWELI